MATLTATAEPLALNSGSPNIATLKIGGQTLAQAIVTAIHQTDWQGRLALSNQPRKNSLTQSSMHGANWSTPANIVTAANSPVNAPDGSGPMVRLTRAVSGSGYAAYQNGSGLGPVVPILVRMFVRLGADCAQFALSGLGTGNVVFDPVNGVVVSTDPRFDGAGIKVISSTLALVWARTSQNATMMFTCNVVNATTGAYFDAWGAEVLPHDADPLSAYIPTTTSAATVLDYTQAGNQITLGQNPATGATLDWDGSGILPGQNWSWPLALPTITADAFGYAPLIDNVITSSVETGAPKRRRRFTYVPETLSGTLLMAGAQCATLRDFVAVNLQDTQAFDWIDLRDRSAASYVFQKRPSYKQVAAGVDFWTVTMELVKQ